MSRVNYITQETVCPEPKYNSTRHLPQLSPSRCVSPRGCMQGHDLCAQGVYHFWGAIKGPHSYPDCPSNFLTPSLTTCSVLTVRQLHGPSAGPEDVHVPCPGLSPITSGSLRVTPSLPSGLFSNVPLCSR